MFCGLQTANVSRGEMKLDTLYITTESVCLGEKSFQSIIDTKNVGFQTTYQILNPI